jgi:hypothetical protein
MLAFFSSCRWIERGFLGNWPVSPAIKSAIISFAIAAILVWLFNKGVRNETSFFWPIDREARPTAYWLTLVFLGILIVMFLFFGISAAVGQANVCPKFRL